MSIATEKIKLATERFLLVRMNPGRFILPVINAGLYEITLPFLVNSLERNGVVLTKDTVSPVSNDHWYQNETSGLLQVKLALAPDDVTNVLVAFHYLFYTGTKFRNISEDPEDALTPLREWEPRIKNYPSISQAFDNIIQGVFTINDISLEIINEARTIQGILDEEDSFYNKDVDVWLCITSISNITRIFSGTIKKLVVSQNTVTFTCADAFNRLVQPAFMGDSNDEVYASSDGFPDVDQGRRDFPIPYICGPFSRYTTSLATESVSGLDVVFSILEANTATDISYEAPATSSNNRTWMACRQKCAVATQAFGSLVRVTAVGSYKFVDFASIANVMIGDTIKYNQGGTDYYALVRYVGAFSYSANAYNCVVTDIGGALALTSIVANKKSFALSVQDIATGELFECVYDRDFTINDATITSGGNRFVKILFVNNFEAAISLPSFLDVISHYVLYRSTNSSPETHGQVLKDILAKVNIDVNVSSFTATDALFVTNVAFAIPNFDESDYDTYLKYVQDVLKSTLAFLRVNSSFEVEYSLLMAPTSSAVRDSSLILQDSPSCDIEYQDMVTSLIAYNPHNSSQFETMKTSTPSETRTNTKARYLHGFENTNRFRHVLQSITDRIDAHIGIKSLRFAKYHLETATEDIDSELGDDLELNDKIVVGTSQIQDVKIIGIEKSPGKVSMDASDLKGI